jgi:hypothetical protein
MSASCVECGRTFDLLTDGAEIAYGHDCEPTPQSYSIYDLPYYSSPQHVMEDQS